MGTGRVFLKSHASIFTYWLINQSIDRFVNGRTKQTEGHISRAAGTRTHYLTDLWTETRITLLTYKNRGVTGTGRVYFQSETSIFTYWLTNQSIDLSIDIQNGQRYIPVGNQTSGHITWLIYQWRLGYPYWGTQIDGRAVSISNLIHKYSPIDRFIDQLISLSTDGRNGRRDTPVGKQTPVLIYRPIYQRRHGDAYQRIKIYGWAVSISNARHQYTPTNQ